MEDLELDGIEELVRYLNRLGWKSIPNPVTPEMVLKVDQKRPMYDRQDVTDILIKLKQYAKTESKGQKAKTSARYKEWAEAREKKIRQKEDALWSRKSYQKDLDELADRMELK